MRDVPGPAWGRIAPRDRIAAITPTRKEIVVPIYEYHCDTCGEDFECLVFGSEKPECRGCKSKKVRKRMSACGFVSKGAAGRPAKTSAGSSCGGCHAGSCAGCKH
jgi:putative FmdB family regulatory protein